MTIYLNPQTMSKEEFLQKHGVKVDPSTLSSDDFNDHSRICMVCLVNNGLFTAAGVIYGERDYREFLDKSDLRPKTFFMVRTSIINAEGGPNKKVE